MWRTDVLTWTGCRAGGGLCDGTSRFSRSCCWLHLLYLYHSSVHFPRLQCNIDQLTILPYIIWFSIFSTFKCTQISKKWKSYDKTYPRFNDDVANTFNRTLRSDNMLQTVDITPVVFQHECFDFLGAAADWARGGVASLPHYNVHFPTTDSPGLRERYVRQHHRVVLKFSSGLVHFSFRDAAK